MKLIANASNDLIDELSNTRVEVKFSDKGIEGYPYFDFMFSNKVQIKEYDQKEVENPLGRLSLSYVPFTVTVNDAFHTAQETMFFTNPDYKNHIDAFTQKVLEEIDSNVQLRLGKWDILDYLDLLQMRLNTIKNSFRETSVDIPEEGNTAILRNSNAKISANDQDLLNIPYSGDWVFFVLSSYWKVQLKGVSKIIDYINVRREIIEKSDDYVKAISDHQSFSGLLTWEASDTDLLELIVSLLESKAIQNSSKSLTRKEAIEAFCMIFNLEIKDAESKLSRATERKKDLSPFLSKLKDSFETYVQKKDERMDNYRR